MSGARGILRFDRTVADLDRTAAFYRDGLGFVAGGSPEPLPSAEAEVLGLRGRQPRRLTMRLGCQTVTFVALDPPDAPRPGPRATDPAFQHLAIPVREMAVAHGRVAALGAEPITQGGPQRLPASSGGVTAWKFRDPDGHPLELIFFPDGPPAARWADAPGLFLGIDHSAITVTGLDETLAFLTGPLGLAMSERGLNRGPEQARLDGLDDPVVDVIALQPPEPTPHVELLHYRKPERGGVQPARAQDAESSATRFVFAADDPPSVAEALSTAGFRVSLSADRRACHIVGPDGHGFLILGST